MDYKGPTQDDLANIQALNGHFLREVSGAGVAEFGDLARRRLTDSERARLAAAPFLLFSFREQDANYWQCLLGDDPQFDLIDAGASPSEGLRHLQAAGLSFLWQLSRRNPYVTRVVSGAPVSWCEQLAGWTLVGLLDRAASRHDLLTARFADDDTIWRRLLDTGVDSKRSLRCTSHHSALQALLTRGGQQGQHEALSAAACNMPSPVRQRAFQTTRSNRHTKV